MEYANLDLSMYEYLDMCKDGKEIYGVGVITDKQFVFYARTDDNDDSTKEEMVEKIENTINPNREAHGIQKFNPLHTYIYSTGNQVTVNLPQDGISGNQFLFLSEALKDICIFNQEHDDEINIEIFSVDDQTSYEGHNDLELQKIMFKLINEKYEDDTDEIIIGSTLLGNNKSQIGRKI